LLTTISARYKDEIARLLLEDNKKKVDQEDETDDKSIREPSKKRNKKEIPREIKVCYS
jgi:hypothetical protein